MGSRNEARKKKPNKVKPLPADKPLSPCDYLALATDPLIEFLAEVDTIFSEEVFMSEKDRTKALGQMYRAWKKCRTVMDPNFDSGRYRLKALMNEGVVGKRIKIERSKKI